ncbi:putative glycolipid-binding domain-containing protein [Pseudalkalibacillus berkeleyi]|uniref:Glycolipid-binding domain-containing protein n=1 Tax=Pseudalkalibacillus berkeleyi TaxID=1069813 RepID=A0ABS9H2L1_9BACL|nr:putative glycolipid-binding domain-containing protein [Pseudalkalibacillus berkeleyi]MCF6138296.1 putative glycolipid-binding domain-containing protein [Pseudalkalibacillus berkeleyi]
MYKKVFWEHKEQSGSEFLRISENDTNIKAEGLVLYTSKRDAYKFSYEVITDNRWFTKSIEIINLELNEKLQLDSNCKGKWFLHNSELVEMDGIIDIDISMTPFSNTLPINRFEWEEGQERNFNVLYIDVPTLGFMKLEQQYKFKGYSEGGTRKFHYKCRDYETVITVDQDGLILEYPGVFIRRY